MTYDELKTQIANYLNRSDLTSQMDTFIDTTEGELNRRLRSKDMVKRALELVRFEHHKYSSSITPKLKLCASIYPAPIELLRTRTGLPLETPDIELERGNFAVPCAKLPIPWFWGREFLPMPLIILYLVTFQKLY